MTEMEKTNMAKANELKLYQREHFQKKIETKLEPEIEREELKIKTTVNKILDKGIKSFSKTIGADKVIARLEKAEDEKREASRLAYTFFNNKASSIVSYSKAKEYKFDRDEKNVLISLKNGQKNKQNNTLKQLNKVSDYLTLKLYKLKLKTWLLKRLYLMI